MYRYISAVLLLVGALPKYQKDRAVLLSPF